MPRAGRSPHTEDPSAKGKKTSFRLKPQKNELSANSPSTTPAATESMRANCGDPVESRYVRQKLSLWFKKDKCPCEIGRISLESTTAGVSISFRKRQSPRVFAAMFLWSRVINTRSPHDRCARCVSKWPTDTARQPPPKETRTALVTPHVLGPCGAWL